MLGREHTKRRAIGFALAMYLVISPCFTNISYAAPERADLPISNSNNGPTWISSTGRYILISSNYSLLSDGQGSGYFLRDRQSQTTTRIPTPGGNQVTGYSSLTEDLRYAVLYTDQAILPQDTNNTFDVYVLDRDTNTFELISQSDNGDIGNGISETQNGSGVISGDGRFVIFDSYATNLDGGTDNNYTPGDGGRDVFIRDRTLNTTRRISNDSMGNAGDAQTRAGYISEDGSTFVLRTQAPSISGASYVSEQIVAIDRITGQKQRISAPQGIPDNSVDCGSTAVSANGRYVAFACFSPMLANSYSSAYNSSHVYRYDRVTNNLRIVDFLDDGTLFDSQHGPLSVNISSDGQRIVFYDEFSGYYWDASRGTAIKYTDTAMQGPLMSADGRIVTAQEIGGGSRSGVWTLPPYSATPSDETVPEILPHLSSQPDANGWNSAPVTLTWSINDLDSPIAATHGCETITVTDTTQQTYTCIAASAGGVAVKSIDLKVDSTVPNVQPHISPTQNSSGWTSSDTTVSWTITDPESPISNSTGCSTATVTADTNGTTYTCTATSGGGTSSNSIIIKKDSVAPTIGTPTMSGGVDLTLLGLGYIFTGNSTNISATVSDGLSGVTYAEYSLDNGPKSAMTTSNGSATTTASLGGLASGQHVLSVRSRDAAGNWSSVSTTSFTKL